jgi:uncharacterized YccA/Bax inhibitor family protein
LSAAHTSNPAFRAFDTAAWTDVRAGAAVMTVQGTIGKTFALLGFLSATAIWSWNALSHHQLQPVVLPAAAIGALVLAILTIVRPSLAPWTAPIYAAFEGVVLGTISYIVENLVQHKFGQGYPGIAIQAVSLTAGTLFCMLFVYTTGLVRVTERLKAGILAATGAVCLVYLVAFALRFFGMTVPFLYSATPIGIGFSLFVVGLAAFNLLLDFDSIEQGARMQAPKYMEWYGAFGLMVTLIWLYLEVVRLLMKLQDRR